MAEEEIVRIIHVSDFHLFVDSNGNDRDARERKAFIRLLTGVAQAECSPDIFRDLVTGFSTHSRQTLEAFVATLRRLAEEYRNSKVVIVQTGDVEAFGWSQQEPHFPGFDYWQDVAGQLKTIQKIIDIYGNHDVWPGTLPGASPHSAWVVELLLLQRPEFHGLFPERSVLPTGICPVEFYRINTIRPGFIANTMALGRIDADRRIREQLAALYPESRTASALDEVAALAASSKKEAQPPVRVLVMHHPPHFFDGRGSVLDLAEGRLENGEALKTLLARLRVHLILAGHRHKTNPSPGIELIPAQYGAPQPPLPNTTVQLSAGTATQMVSGSGDERPAFSMYRLVFKRETTTLDIQRTVFRHLNPTYTHFQAGQVESLASSLPLA